MSLNPEHILEHGPFLRGLARSLLRDAARADDVVQEAWLAAMRRPHAVRDLRPWLVGVVRNLVRREKRSAARREAREQRVLARSPARRPEDVLETEDARRRLVEALLSLEEPYRSPLLLRYYDDLPPREIAKRLDVPGSTVRSRIQRGLEQLRHKLDANHGGDRRAWCLALVPLALDPRFAAVPTGAALTGVVSMKIKVTFVVLAIVACVFLFLELGRADGTARQPSVAAVVDETPAPHPDGAAKRGADPESEPDVPAAATVRMRGTVKLDDGASTQVEVTVRGALSGGGLMKERVDASVPTNIRFEIALDPLFAGEAPMGLEVTFAHPEAKEETKYLMVRKDPQSGAPVIDAQEITLRRVSIARGTVRNGVGDAVPGTTLAAFPTDGGQPDEASVADVLADNEGSFELRVPGEGAHLIVAAAPGYRPKSVVVEVSLGEPLVLEQFGLESGAAVTGRVTQTGGGALAGAVVAATLPGSALNLAIPDSDFQLCYLDGRVEHRSVHEKTGADGSYRIAGLLASDYKVSVKRVAAAHSGLTFGVSKSEYEVVVRPPAAGVGFEIGIATITVSVRAAGKPLPGAKLTLTQHKKSELGTAHSSNWVQLDETGRATRAVSPGVELTVKVEAPGMRTQKRALHAPAAGGAVDLAFDMERAQYAKLLVKVDALGDNPPPIPPFMEFSLRPLPEGEVIQKSSQMKDGVHVVDEVEAGRYEVTARAGRADYYFPVVAEVTVAPGTAQRLTLRPRVGGRLHILYVARDGRTDRPAFVKLILPDGTESEFLRIFKSDGSNSTEWSNSLPDTKGPGRIRRVLEPGLYKVTIQPYDESKEKLTGEIRVEAGKTVVAELRE
ncbi:MAG: sigma-70 family RNA polymerase sigma factor [Planctomycetota bacterium]|jgi:RNA polymerase sigma-70 factor (ECF subfamily)